jgi:uncharacterized protein YecT (DUF1311 family)
MAARFASTWRGAAIAIFVLAAPTPLLAAPSAETYYSKTYSACMDTAGGSTLPMKDCIGAEYDSWDRSLNLVYQTLMGARTAEAKIRLRDEERAWLARTEVKCAHAGDDDAGGSLQTVDIDQCNLDERIKRTVYLRGLH